MMKNINGSTALYGVMGMPVSHSLSPLLHNRWFHEHGINAIYVPLPVESECLQNSAAVLPRIGCRGWNITLPHKQAIIPFLHKVEVSGIEAGAVNTVKVVSRECIGYNTDIVGFWQPICERSMIKNKPVVILGAGGAAYAIVAALKQQQFQDIRIVNRTIEKAKQLAAERCPDATIFPLQNMHAAMEGAQLVVNTTSAHHNGESGKLTSYAWDATSSECLAYDISYGKTLSNFLQSAAAANRQTLDGLPMLAFQAAAAFQLWHGVKPVVSNDLLAWLSDKV